jgi:hypothetical protein
VAGASFFALIEKTGTDLTGISSAAIIFTHMNGIDTDVVAIQDSKTCGNDLAVFCYGSADSFLKNGTVHGRNDASMDRICSSFQVKKAVDPEIRNFIGKKHIGDRRIQNGIVQVYSHNICYVLNGIAPVFQHIVKIRGYKGADLKDRRSSQTLIDLFAVGDFFAPWKCGGSELFHTVGPVRIEIRKT